MRRSMCKLLAANNVTDDPERWLDRSIGSITDKLSELGEATARQVGEALPEPPGLEEVRKAQAAAAERARREAEGGDAAAAERK